MSNTKGPTDPSWPNLSDDEKLLWLDGQGLPGNDSVKLGTLYRRGKELNAYFKLLSKLLKSLVNETSILTNNKLRLVFNSFISAFNKFVQTFGNSLWTDVQSLLRDGKLGQLIAVLANGYIDTVVVPSGDKPTPSPRGDDLWGTIADILSVLLSKVPALQSMHPPELQTTYAEIVQDLVQSGRTFYLTWTGQKEGTDQTSGTPQLKHGAWGVADANPKLDLVPIHEIVEPEPTETTN